MVGHLLADQASLLSMLFRMELSDLPDVLQQVAPMLGAWLHDGPQSSLKRDVAAWVEQLLAREKNSQELVEAVLIAGGTEVGARKFATWSEALEDRGLQRGLEQGIQQGLQQGLERGIEQGIEQEQAREASRLRDFLHKVLSSQHPTIPESIQARMAAASIDELHQMINDALDGLKPGSSLAK